MISKTSKTLLITFTFSFLAFNGLCQDLNYQMAKGQKVIGSFSGEFDGKQSIHLLIYQNKSSKVYTTVPFFIAENEEKTQLPELSFEEKPKVVSYHYLEEEKKVILLISHEFNKINRLSIFDLTLGSKTYTKKSIDGWKSADLNIRVADKTLLARKAENVLQITTVKNSKELDTLVFAMRPTKSFKKIFDMYPQLVNTREYVELGSSKNAKAYYQNGKIVLDAMIKDSYETFVINVKDTAATQFIEIKNSLIESAKETNSYVFGDNLFLFLHLVEDIALQVYDLNSGSLQYEGNLLKDFFEEAQKENIENLIKKSGRKRYRLMGTVNRSVEDQLVVRLDYVDMNVYNYHYDWWFHHWFFQQQMWQQQQMMQSISVPNFGPNSAEEEILLDFTKDEEQQTQVEFVLSMSFEHLPSASKETKYRQTDKNFYIDSFKNNRNIDHTTMSFTEKSVRYIYYAKLGKLFYIKSQPLRK